MSSDRLTAFQRGRLTTGAFLGLWLSGTVVAAPGALLPQWTATFGDGLNLGAFYAMQFLGLLLGIFLSSRQQVRQPTLGVALVLMLLGLVAAVVVPTVAVVTLTSVLLGLGKGTVDVQGNSLTGELHPQRRVVMVNWANAALGIGAVMTPLLASVLPWQAVYLLIGAVALLTALLTLDAPETQTGPVVVAGSKALGASTDWKLAALLMAAIAFHSGLEGALATWSGTALQERASQGALLTLYWLGLTFGRLALAPWVAQAPEARLRVLALVIALTTALYFVGPLSVGWPLLGVLLGPVFGTLFALAQERAGSALVAPVMYAAALGGTLLPGVLGDVPPWGLPLGFAVFALAQWWAVHRVTRQLGQVSVSP
ncbi:MFS transporter [Deinococcus frigens]|uniref:MFS transporter n=1 Tax=Deinococcus frigens TaxID=249403 RepID=UPI00068E9E94|nr:MFS transporter [Deinococcus frigens]